MSAAGPQRSQTVAIFVPSLGASGAERVAVNLGKGLLKAGRPVDLVVADATGSLRSQIPEGVRLVDLDTSRVLTSLPPLVRYLRQQRPAGLIAFMHHANIVALWARRLAGTPTRVVATVHNTMSVATQRPKNHRSRLAPLFVRGFYGWADEIVAVSQGVADDLVQGSGLSPERVKVIYNPVVTDDLLAALSSSPPHPWLEPGEPPVIMGVGRLTAQKDFSTLLRAFALVRRRCRARLMIMGEGEDRPVLEALARELGIADDVALPGFRLGIHAFLARAAVFALSSAWEGLPTVVIEALALGRRVVSTDCPSGPREILQGGRFGRLVPVRDHEALGKAILDSLERPVTPVPPEALDPFTEETAVARYLRAVDGGSEPS